MLKMSSLLIVSLTAATLTAAPPARLVAQTAVSTQANESALKDALFRMRGAIDRYYVDKKKYPSSLKALVTNRYIDVVPIDPFTQRSGSWQIRRPRRDPKRPTAAAGVYDVKSGSTGRALDGTKYSDW